MKPRQKVSPARMREYLAQLKKREEGKKPSEMRMAVQSILSRYAGVVRTEEGLRKGLKELYGVEEGEDRSG